MTRPLLLEFPHVVYHTSQRTSAPRSISPTTLVFLKDTNATCTLFSDAFGFREPALYQN